MPDRSYFFSLWMGRSLTNKCMFSLGPLRKPPTRLPFSLPTMCPLRTSTDNSLSLIYFVSLYPSLMRHPHSHTHSLSHYNLIIFVTFFVISIFIKFIFLKSRRQYVSNKTNIECEIMCKKIIILSVGSFFWCSTLWIVN